MKKWIFRTAATVVGLILPPIVGTFIVCAIVPLITRGHHHGPFWASLLIPIANPEVFFYAFIMMGPSALAYGLFMTWLGCRPSQTRSGRSEASRRVWFICCGAGIGLLSPLGTLIWASKYASLMDYVRWFALIGLAGATTGAVCALTMWPICKMGKEKEPKQASEATLEPALGAGSSAHQSCRGAHEK